MIMSFIAHYCVPAVWIGFYLYHAIRLSNPSPKLKNRFSQYYSPNQVPVVIRYLAIGAWLGTILNTLSLLAGLVGITVNFSLAGFFYACVLLVYILIVHLSVRHSIK